MIEDELKAIIESQAKELYGLRERPESVDIEIAERNKKRLKKALGKIKELEQQVERLKLQNGELSRKLKLSQNQIRNELLPKLTKGA